MVDGGVVSVGLPHPPKKRINPIKERPLMVFHGQELIIYKFSIFFIFPHPLLYFFSIFSKVIEV